MKPELPEPRAIPPIIKLAAINTICFASIGVMTPVLDPLVRERFDVGNAATAQFMGIQGAASMLFGIVAGILSDKTGRRVPLIVLGLIGNGITTALTPHISDFSALLVLRFLDGIFGGLSLGLIITRALDLAGPADRRNVVSFHDAFPYFAAAYGMTIVGTVVDAPGQDPSAGELGDLIREMRATGATVIFSEAQFNDALVQAIAADAGATVVNDLYDDTLGNPPADTYAGMMRWNADRVLEAVAG